ncbi:MAG: hypothetical protein V2I43_21250 [Parvularcula sp.]|jgi:hypothetical protein|nr:hypothetical protein [Parvularcula sp.]
MVRWVLSFCAIAAVAGCHTRPHDAEEGLRGGLKEGMLAPLEDINVRREEIPPVLSELDVYDKPVPRNCDGIADEVSLLESYVGDDVDVLALDAPMGLRRQAMSMMDGQAYSVVSDLTTDLIPFRGMVRRATGATAHERAIREAYRNGRLRRSYLKGVGFAKGCDGVAAPRFVRNDAKAVQLQNDAEAASFPILEVPPPW